MGVTWEVFSSILDVCTKYADISKHFCTFSVHYIPHANLDEDLQISACESHGYGRVKRC